MMTILSLLQVIMPYIWFWRQLDSSCIPSIQSACHRHNYIITSITIKLLQAVTQGDNMTSIKVENSYIH